MDAIYRETTEKDRMFFNILRAMASFSRCVDKKVACLITDTCGQYIYGIAVNDVIQCDHNCHDKERRICKVIHAEESALNRCNQAVLEHAVHARDLVAYVNLFPCKPCQETLRPFVSEICAIGPIHKELVYPVTIFTPEDVWSDGYRPF
jgi:deoxycytidylate deaminase